MINFLSGALTLAYLLAGIYFYRFWRRIPDRLFLHFAIAFWLFAANETVNSMPSVNSQTAGYEYLLRVVGFIWILIAIAEKNFFRSRK